MDIKVIAADMDGTFLTTSKEYNKEKFEKVFNYLEREDIKYVAISGDQYFQIREYFTGFTDRMTIVGDNGSYFVENDNKLKVESIDREVVSDILHFLIDNDYHLDLLLDAENQAYILREVDEEKKKIFQFYHTKLKVIDSYFPLPNDRFTKLTFDTEIDETYEVIDKIQKIFGYEVEATTSGNGNIDVIKKGANKGAAMEYLLDRWDLSGDNLMAFGDGDNDIEMIKLAKYSYAMDNASENLKKEAKYITKSNDEDGVLDTIIEFFNIE